MTPYQDDYGEVEDYDFVPIPNAGTINRPLYGERGKQPVRWGDTLVLKFIEQVANTKATGQFLRVDLPEPRVCALAFHATLYSKIPALAKSVVVGSTNIDITIGVGSSSYTRHYAFTRLPEANSELYTIIPDVPVSTLYVTGSAFLKTGVVGLGNEVIITITGQITPVVPV